MPLDDQFLTCGVMDHRSVPLEVLRDFARSEAELTSIRLAADDAGVGRSTLHKFITAGTKPHLRVRRRLALWYLRRLPGVHDAELVRPYVSILRVPLADVPELSRRRVTLDVLDSIGHGYECAGEAKPRWLEVLRTRLVTGFLVILAGSVLAWSHPAAVQFESVSDVNRV
jgi:hypothetical protein